jgi:hypothetical protein
MIEYVRYAGVAQLVEHLICNPKTLFARGSEASQRYENTRS